MGEDKQEVPKAIKYNPSDDEEGVIVDVDQGSGGVKKIITSTEDEREREAQQKGLDAHHLQREKQRDGAREAGVASRKKRKEKAKRRKAEKQVNKLAEEKEERELMENRSRLRHEELVSKGKKKGEKEGRRTAELILTQEGRNTLQPVLDELVDSSRGSGIVNSARRGVLQEVDDWSRGGRPEDFTIATASGRAMIRSRESGGDVVGSDDRKKVHDLMVDLGTAREHVRYGSVPNPSGISIAERNGFNKGFGVGSEGVKPDFSPNDRPWFVPSPRK